MKIKRLRSPTRSPRELTAQEHQLWTEVTRQVIPNSITEVSRCLAVPEDHKKYTRAQPPPIYSQHVNSKLMLAQTSASLERRTLRKLKRGVRLFDQKLDLHGMSQLEAHKELSNFLVKSQIQGAQLVLVITGKGKDATDEKLFSGGGVLRRHVPQWLRSFRGLVHGFEEAPPRFGGGGALLVRLCRPSLRQNFEWPPTTDRR